MVLLYSSEFESIELHNSRPRGIMIIKFKDIFFIWILQPHRPHHETNKPNYLDQIAFSEYNF